MSEKQPLNPGYSVSVDERKYEVKTDKCGVVDVYVQGNLSSVNDKTPVFLTVHDIGSNYTEFHHLIEHPSMKRVRDKSVFLHVEIPGQGFKSPDLPGQHFPSMQDFGEDMVCVLNHFGMKYVVTLGEGAGANILIRFSMKNPEKVLGNILIHCTSSGAGVMEFFNEKLMNWKLHSVGMNPSAEQYLVYHKFGHQIESAANKERVVQEYATKLYSRINPKNLTLYVESFLNRTELNVPMLQHMEVDTLLVTGGKASHNHTVHTMHAHMDPKRTTLLKVDDVGDVIYEAPDKLAQGLILFCQGVGLLSTLPISRQSSLCQ